MKNPKLTLIMRAPIFMATYIYACIAFTCIVSSGTLAARDAYDWTEDWAGHLDTLAGVRSLAKWLQEEQGADQAYRQKLMINRYASSKDWQNQAYFNLLSIGPWHGPPTAFTCEDIQNRLQEKIALSKEILARVSHLNEQNLDATLADLNNLAYRFAEIWPTAIIEPTLSRTLLWHFPTSTLNDGDIEIYSQMPAVSPWEFAKNGVEITELSIFGEEISGPHVQNLYKVFRMEEPKTESNGVFHLTIKVSPMQNCLLNQDFHFIGSLSFQRNLTYPIIPAYRTHEGKSCEPQLPRIHLPSSDCETDLILNATGFKSVATINFSWAQGEPAKLPDFESAPKTDFPLHDCERQRYGVRSGLEDIVSQPNDYVFSDHQSEDSCSLVDAGAGIRIQRATVPIIAKMSTL